MMVLAGSRLGAASGQLQRPARNLATGTGPRRSNSRSDCSPTMGCFSPRAFSWPFRQDALQVCPFREQAETGGLLSYSPILPTAIAKSHTMWSDSQGPPMCRSSRSKFELVINLQTPKVVGLTIPPRCYHLPTR